MTSPYPSSAEHLSAEFGRLDALLRQRLDAVGGATPDGTPDPDRAGGGITDRVAASLEAGIPLRLVVLAQLFELALFDVDVVVACLAPDVDSRYERVYATLHDDPARCAPSVGLILDVFCGDLDARMAGRARLGATAPLLRHRLVALDEPADRRSSTVPARTITLDPRVARFLLEDDSPDERLRAVARLSVPTCALDQLVLPSATADRLRAVAADPDPGLLLYLRGGPGTGKRTTAAALCATWGTALLVVDGKALLQRPLDEFEETLARLDREARLQGAILYWDGADALGGEERAAHRELLLSTLVAHPGPAVLGGGAAWEPARGNTVVETIELPAPGPAERARLWAAALDGTLPAADPADVLPAIPALADLAEPAARFRLSGRQIRGAAVTARGLAADRGAPQVSTADLFEAARRASSGTLHTLARRVTTRHGWDDLVIPPDRTDQLREIVDQVRHRDLVHGTWGLGAQAGGRGLTVLFAGPSGTGKTMAAGVLAHTLGLDLYAIDLAGVVSKFIGETEQNLARIFDDAAAGNAVLFFDEADALFGKRTQVRDAHDRYANLETSYLLQKLEEHEGVVVLATNLRKNMDDAFVRRLHVTVEFPVPEPADRLRIWERVWPDATPRAGIDLEALAREVDLPGGHIRNIAVAGAFLAAADGGVVTMEHVLAATRREYQKLGKVVIRTGSG